MNTLEKYDNFTFYSSADGTINIRVLINNDTIWLNQKDLANTFGINVSGITRHLKNIFITGELIESENVKTIQVTGSLKPVSYYNLNVIIAVGYRVNSYKATQFRIWATKVLAEYATKGFVLDDERLKQGKNLFGKDYFDELLERIREIRASERRFYQKITDIYKECSYDYDKDAQITRQFYSNAQNKLEYAITKMTAAEIIHARANHKLPYMGLQTWKNQGKGGKILKSDIMTAKNYLTEDEIKDLNRLVTMFLDYAENLAEKHKPMSMKDWNEKLDGFLKFNEYEILQDFGKIEQQTAKLLATKEYEKFKPIQDANYISDFDEILEQIQAIDNEPK